MGRGRPGVVTRDVDRSLRFALAAAFCVAASFLPSSAHARHLVNRIWAPVLIFHHVQPFRPSDDAIERGLTIPPQQFRQEISYLAGHHYHVLTAAQVTAALLHGHRLPRRPVVLTFDDGYSDMASNVVPVLRRHHMRATFFIIAGLVGHQRYLTWRQVREMSREGMDIEAHTMTHPDLTTVPKSQVRGEIYTSRQVLQSRLHRPVRVFAYPYGAYDPYVIQTLRKAGFEAAFTTRQGWWLNRNAMLTLPRVYVDNDDTLRIFAGRLRANSVILAQDPT